jgi:hypothetical protein
MGTKPFSFLIAKTLSASSCSVESDKDLPSSIIDMEAFSHEHSFAQRKLSKDS